MSLIELIWRLWVHVFIFVIGGWMLGRVWPDRFGDLIRRLVALSIYGLVPLFAFVIMWNAELAWRRFPVLAASVLGVLGGGAALAWLLARAWNKPFRHLCLPVVFMNSIYLALPVNLFVFGEAGAAVTVVFNLVVTVAHFSVGVWWVRRAGRSGWGEVFGIPILYAVVAGAVLNGAEVARPSWLPGLYGVLASLALPMMLVLVGVRLGQVRATGWSKAMVAAVARMGGGALFGWMLCRAFGLEGVEKGVVILTSSMPAAVNTYVLAEKFDAEPAFAAAVVTATTAASLVTIPLLAYLLK